MDIKIGSLNINIGQREYESLLAKAIDSALNKTGEELKVKVDQCALDIGGGGKSTPGGGTGEAVKSEINHDLLALAMEQAAEAVAITDAMGTIQYVNPSFARITGYSREESIGKNMNILKSGEHTEEFYRNMWDQISKGEVWNGRFVNRKKDGALYLEDTTISPVRNSAGKIVNYLAAKRDVSSKVALEKQICKADKMEAIGRLAGGIAHNINNLLQIIQGYSELLLLNRKEGEPGQRELREIINAAQRGGDLNQQLLVFSLKVKGNYRQIDLNNVIKQLQKPLAQKISKTVELELLLSDDLKNINADPEQIGQVLKNLAANANNAMPKGGKFIIETQNVTLDEDFCRFNLGVKPGEHVLLTVSDSGRGMDKEILDHIFEPFYTSNDPGKGPGLGLAVVYGIVKTHHGHIICQSLPLKGTTFKIYLPVTDSAE